jgi:hypothetical protein
MDPLFVVAPPSFEDLWENAGIRDGIGFVEPENIPTEIVQEEDIFYF